MLHAEGLVCVEASGEVRQGPGRNIELVRKGPIADSQDLLWTGL